MDEKERLAKEASKNQVYAFIDSLGLECGEELKAKIGEKGWEWAEELVKKCDAMKQIIVLLVRHADTIPHEVVHLGLIHDINLFETEVPDCFDTGYKGAVPETCKKCEHKEDCD